MKEMAALLIAAGLTVAVSQEYVPGGHALFVRTSPSSVRDAHSRVQRAAPISAADVMAQNILEWIQGIYRQGARKPRQQSDPPGYLPPYSTQRPPERPRPFQPPSTTTGFPSGPSTTVQSPPYSTQRQTYLPPSNQPSSYNPRPTTTPSYGTSAFPPYSSTPSTPRTPGYSTAGGISTSYGYSTPDFTTAGPAQFSTPAGFSTTYGYPPQRPSPSYVPSADGSSFDTGGAGYPSSPGYPSSSTPGGAFPPQQTGGGTGGTGGTGGAGYPSSPGYPSSSTPGGAFPPQQTGGGTGGTRVTRPPGTPPSGGTTGGEDDESKHPPHIHSLDVVCSKTMMTINIEFNRAFDGVIYSKGYFMNPECRYVEQNSGQTQYSFTVNLDSCGTQFINDFAGEAGQAYLENVLVLQNEPGIQEVWDTVRRVRCLWEGNINKALTVNFSVDMLNQEIVTFSGDTATARLDIQVGRGPFAPAADGLVKIGETMTLVVTVEGDPGFDLQVRDCLARDESSANTVQLTDERGCILKPKLFGAFQKTNDTGNTGASIIAYAYFQAFKFPDVMDLFIECNVELCKTDCEPCPDANQQIEPGRRRRSINTYAASTNASSTTSNGSPVLLSDPIRVARRFKVIMVDDLSKASNQILQQLEETAVEEVATSATSATNVCMTHSGFYTAISFFLTTILVTTISAVTLYVKLQRVYGSKFIYS